MSRRPQDKQGTAGSGGNTFTQAALREIDPSSRIVVDDNNAPFLLNPATWDENKSTNWIEHVIPGQSSPIYQWISGGPRTLSFEALVTKDTKYYPGPQSATQQLLGKATKLAENFVGNIASKFAGANLPSIASFLNPSPSQSTLAIDDYLAYYRSLLYPIYDDTGNIEQSPPLLVVDLGDQGPGTSIHDSSSVWILLSLSIKITKQTPDLHPMEAMVTFQLANYIFTSNPRQTESVFSGFTGDTNLGGAESIA